MTGKIMRMSVAAGRHDQTLTGMINDLCSSFFNKFFGSTPVTCINIFPVFYGKCFNDLIILGSENLSKDNKILNILFIIN